MSIYENLKKVFSELVQKLGLLLKCCKNRKMREKVVTEVKNEFVEYRRKKCHHTLEKWFV